jgi:hypothetical protein
LQDSSATASPFPLEWSPLVAKKKPRTPPPPRRVQAPKHRPEQRSSALPIGDLGRGQRNVLYAVAASGIVALVIVVALVAFGGSNGDSGQKHVAALMTAAGCSFKTVKAYVPPGQPVHVVSLTKKFPWNTDPPSNGQHYPLWAVWGFYTDPVNPRMVVHNEEHGGVILWWGSGVDSATVEQLRTFYNEKADGSFGTPYPKLGNRIAISAWTGNTADYGRNNYYGFGHLATCNTWNAKTRSAFEAFRNEYRGKGPEGIPLSLDEPGMGPRS